MSATSTPVASTARAYAPDDTVPTVPITPTRPDRVAWTRARAPGSITSKTGTGSSAASSPRPAAAAVLQATTTALASKSLTRLQASSRAKTLTSPWGLGPYG